MVARRLLWLFEQRNIISTKQCGFMKHQNTITHLLDLKEEILEAFQNQCYVMSIFFDIEKAYDTAWRHSILKKLIDNKIK